MSEFFMQFTELWLVGVGDIVAQVAEFFFADTIGNVLLGVLVFNIFCLYIIRPATHANSDTVLTRGLAYYADKQDYDADKILGQLELQRIENIRAQERERY